MTVLREWLVRLRSLLRPDRRDADLEEELRAHLALAADAGMGRDAAGGIAQSMDAVRDQRGVPWIDDLARDIRHGLRSLRRSPTFTCASLVTLTIGIAANTSVFSIVNAVLLKPLPYPDADRLVAVSHTAPGAQGLSSVSGDLRLSLSMYVTYAEQNRTFDHMGVWFPGTATVTGIAEPEQVRVVVVADGTLQALAVQPIAGRAFTAADHRADAPRTVVLGHGYWLRRFGGDPGVVGRRLLVDSAPCEIVGVMPAGFQVVSADTDLVVPIRIDRSRLTLPGFAYQAVARLKPGATAADANADIGRLVPIWMSSWPAVNGNPRVYETWRITPAVRPLKQEVVGSVGRSLWVLMATIGIVLVIACANVATLLLVRADARQQELAIRTALGAGAARIVRALLVESVLLGLTGGAAGLAVAAVAVRLFVAHGPATLPRLNEIAIDPRVVGFALAVSVISGLAFGAIAAVRHASPDVAARLAGAGRTSSGGRERRRARNTLVVAQVALAFVLLVGAGLMIRTLRALHGIDPGFVDAASLQTVRMTIPPSLVAEPERVARMQQAIVERVAALPGVRGAAFGNEMAMEGFPPNWDAVRLEHVAYAPADIPPLRVFLSISPGFFQTTGTRLVAGRDYTWPDLYGRRPFVIVSENFAREAFGSPAAAIGRRIQTIPSSPWREIIGVVQDVYERGVQEPAPAIVYWPSYGDNPYQPTPTVVRTTTFVVRSPRAGTESFAKELQEIVWSINPSLAFASMRTAQEIYDRSMARTTFTLVMLAVAGAMALALGVIGIYGVIAYAVAQRTREIGIRVALGAERRELTRMFVGSGLRLAAVGIPIGLAASAALTRVMATLLFGVTALDPVTYLAVPLIVAAAAAIASYVPATRAAALDPVEALKVE